MAIAAEATGTKTPSSLATDDVLATTTNAGMYVVDVDSANLVNGETLTIRVKKNVLTGGTERLVYEATFSNVQGLPIKVSPPIASLYSLTASIQQDGGTLRAFPWKLIKLG